MRLRSVVLLCALAGILAACGKKGPASVQGGECKVFSDELAKACGIARDDQRIIDENVESGFSACPNWQQPEARAPSCEQLRAEIASLRSGRPIATPTKRKPSLRKRIKARIWPARAEPVVPLPPMPKAEPALVPSDIVVRPVDPVDDLLDVPSSPTQPTPPPRKKRWFNR